MLLKYQHELGPNERYRVKDNPNFLNDILKHRKQDFAWKIAEHLPPLDAMVRLAGPHLPDAIFDPLEHRIPDYVEGVVLVFNHDELSGILPDFRKIINRLPSAKDRDELSGIYATLVNSLINGK